MKIHISSPEKQQEAIEQIQSLETNGAYEVQIKKLPKARTTAQNKALRVYLGLVASALNEKGFTVNKVVGWSKTLLWDPDFVMMIIWRRCQVKLTGKLSTTEPTKDEYYMIYEYIAKRLVNKFGINIPFPCKLEK